MNKKKRIEFLLQCLELKRDASLPFDPNKLSEKNWDKILKDAKDHRIEPLLYHHLKTKSEISVPDHIRASLEGAFLKNLLDNTRLYHELSVIIKILERENVPTIALKGAYIAREFYPGIALRSMYDLDLLVRSEDIIKTHGILVDSGWGCKIDESQFGDYIQRCEAIKYEKHCVLLELHPGIIEIVNTDAWENSFLTRIGKDDVAVLEHNILLPYLCIHLCEHLGDLFAEIIRIYDIVQIIRQCRDNIDWDKVIQIAEENQSKNDVYRVFYFVKNELGEDIPESVLSRLKEDKHDITILQALHKGRKIREIRPIGHIINAIQMRMFDPNMITIGEIVKLIIGGIFPGRKYMAKKYIPNHPRLFFVYYPVRTVLAIKDVIRSLSYKHKGN